MTVGSNQYDAITRQIEVEGDGAGLARELLRSQRNERDPS